MFPSTFGFDVISLIVSIAVLTLLLLLTLLARWSRLTGLLFWSTTPQPQNQVITLQSIELVSKYFQFESKKFTKNQQQEQPSIVQATIPDINFDLVVDDMKSPRKTIEGRKTSVCSIAESMSSWFHYLPSTPSRRSSFDCLTIGTSMIDANNGQVISQTSSMDSVYSERSDHYLETK